jgi:hypothetical protein
VHMVSRYQFCIFPEYVRPLPSYTYGTKVMAQGPTARRYLMAMPIGHYVQYNREWCWMNLLSTCGGIQVGIPVIVEKDLGRFKRVLTRYTNHIFSSVPRSSNAIGPI